MIGNALFRAPSWYGEQAGALTPRSVSAISFSLARLSRNTVELVITLLAAGTSGSLSPRGRGLGVRGAGHDQSPYPKGRADWRDPSPYPLPQRERAK